MDYAENSGYAGGASCYDDGAYCNIFGVYLLFLAGIILGVTFDKRAKLARALYLTAVAVVAIAGFVITPLRQFFDFTTPNATLLWPSAAIVVVAASVQYAIVWYMRRRR